jgi:membrane protease YdiL (CAAX protease family)
VVPGEPGSAFAAKNPMESEERTAQGQGSAPVGARPSRLRSIGSHPASFVFGAVWLASAAVVITAGHASQLLVSVGRLCGILLFGWLTLAWTERLERQPQPQAQRGQLRVVAQLAVILGVILAVFVDSLRYYGLGHPPEIPVWSALASTAAAAGERWLPAHWVGSPARAVVDPLCYFALPLLALLLLGARPSALGLGRGRGTWRVIAVWCSLPAGFLLLQLATGSLGLGQLARRLVSNGLQNGPSEEFLFRGALQSRLALLVDPKWALILQALAFGAWHLAAMRAAGGASSLLLALANAMLSQAVTGLAFGLMARRTDSIVAGSLFHVIANSLESQG